MLVRAAVLDGGLVLIDPRRQRKFKRFERGGVREYEGGEVYLEFVVPCRVLGGVDLDSNVRAVVALLRNEGGGLVDVHW